MSLKFWTTERRISPLPMNNSPLSLEEQKQSLRCLKVKVESNSNQTHIHHSRTQTHHTVIKSVYKTKTTATTRYVPRATHIAGGLPQPASAGAGAGADKNANSTRSRRVIFPTLYESKTQSSPLYQNQVRDMPQIVSSSLSNDSDHSAIGHGLIAQQGPIKTSSSDEVDNANVDSGDSTTTSSKHSLDPIHNDDDSIECLMTSRRKKNKGGSAPAAAPASAVAAIPPSPSSSLAGDIVAQLALETFDHDDDHNDQQPQPPHRYLSLIIEAFIKQTHPYEVFQLRAMLSVPYFEKALYEMNEEDVTAESIIALANKIEQDIQGGNGPRPLLSVPHIISDEASCYYHGYVLAEMSVHQTRAHFLEKYGKIVDNPAIGKDLAEVYWVPGNSRPFLALVKELTGTELTGKAWVDALSESLEVKLESERRDYDEALVQYDSAPFGKDDDINLGMVMRMVDGDTVLADSDKAGGFLQACKQFEEVVSQRAKAAL